MTIYGLEKDETDSMGLGCMPMSQYVKRMRMDAVKQAKKAFESGGEQVYRAMEVIGEVMLYARRQGLTALAKAESFRNGPYVLDLIEEKLGNKVPMRLYLEFGMEHISYGEEPEDVAELMVNRYFANGYMAADALVAYIYCISIVGMIYGISYAYMLEYFSSLVPDSEISGFSGFAEKKRKQIEDERFRYMCEKLEKKFAAWDTHNGKIVEMDRCSLRSAFSDMLSVMDDNSIYCILLKMNDMDICHSLLGADEKMRKHIMGLLGERHRLKLMEHWMNMPFNAETVEKCMEAMGRVMRTGIMYQQTGTVKESE